MSKPPAIVKERIITQVTPVAGEFLLVQWDRHQMGLVDMRPMVKNLPVMEFLKDLDAFNAVKIAPGGSAVVWLDDEGDEIDIDSATLWLHRKPIAATPPKTAIESAIGLISA